jgi:hypothetical protein
MFKMIKKINIKKIFKNKKKEDNKFLMKGKE